MGRSSAWSRRSGARFSAPAASHSDRHGRRPVVQWLIALALAATLALLTGNLPADTADGSGIHYGAVATVHPQATEVALETLERGGNAVDAAVAAALMLGVVDGHNSGIGGGCFILIRTSEGELVALDGRETAPARAHRDMYVRDGKPLPELARTGPLAVAVPGALAAYAEAVEQHGRRPLAESLIAAASVAEQGFAIDAAYAAALERSAPLLARFQGSRAVLLHEDGRPLRRGERLRQPDLAHTYRSIAEHGIGWFYDGPLAEGVGQWMAEHGGILTADDFSQYRARQREPLVTHYRDWTLVGFPPPSSGGVHVAQILQMIEPFDIRRLADERPDAAAHVLVEAMKLAMADRAYWLGDPDFTPVPRALVDPDYTAQLSGRIDVERAAAVERHGVPAAWEEDLFQRHTTHIAAADVQGNWVAITATVNTSFGSKVIVPGTGVILNNEMDDFSIQPGVPNVFGLVGAEANAVQAGKRPLSSMSPTIVLRRQPTARSAEPPEPVVTLGAAGGPRIITQVVLTLVRHLDLDQPIQEAVAAPRFHHQWFPDQVFAERRLDDAIVAGLQQRGHRVVVSDQAGRTQAISVQHGPLQPVHDPRIQGSAQTR